jgi:transglutaminase-like putative cysteine protease
MTASPFSIPLFLRGPLSMLLMIVALANSLGRSAVPVVLVPNAPGVRVDGNASVKVDLSNTAEGYVMVRYTGTPVRIRMQIIFEKNAPYTYDLATDGTFETFPLSCGSGSYSLNVYRHLKDNAYAHVFGTKFTVKLKDELTPFLYPNQYVKFSAQSKAVSLAQTLCEGAKTDLDAVGRIYDYITGNIAYDRNKADTVQSGYLPDIDEILSTKKGICFDYAAVMTAMLRSQRIPTKLVIGYSGKTYHAWISVWTKQTGWLHNVIRFDGNKWVRMDPTFAAGSNSKQVLDYVGDGKNYNEMFFY